MLQGGEEVLTQHLNMWFKLQYCDSSNSLVLSLDYSLIIQKAGYLFISISKHVSHNNTHIAT